MSTATLRASAAAFAWQGWRLALPPRWNPVKLEGNHDAGYALIADMDRPQLGLRWRTMPAKRFDAERAMRGEVGALAAEKARPFPLDGDTWTGSTLFLEPEPPGRDVWVAHSRTSGRAVEIVHHVRRRDRLLEDAILSALCDTRSDEARPWAVFDLACIVPGGFELATHRLNAGDLSLIFMCKRQMLTVRQVALAGMALNRLPLDKWLTQQERAGGKHYRSTGQAQVCSIGDMTGQFRISSRRRRFSWMRWLPPQVVTYALHDQARDRLVFVQGNDDSILRQLVTTVGVEDGARVIFKKAAKPAKFDMLAARPIRASSAEATPIGPGKWHLNVPVEPSRWASIVLRVPKGMTKTFELDELGKFVWDHCDGKSSVRQIIRKLARQYNLNQREAEVATVAFLKTLTTKGLVAMAVEKPQMNTDKHR